MKSWKGAVNASWRATAASTWVGAEDLAADLHALPVPLPRR